jgi:hypothetical protein
MTTTTRTSWYARRRKRPERPQPACRPVREEEEAAERPQPVCRPVREEEEAAERPQPACRS